jgi:hypothetical protein
MLRNLNRTFDRGRVCGTPKSGVIGSLIPSTGDSGPGYTYNDLSIPDDNLKEICGYITTWPSDGVLYANEDTSFTFTNAPDGVYTFQYQLYVDGVATGSPATVTLQVGDGTTTVNASVGNVLANGGVATINQIRNIGCAVGDAVSTGIAANILLNTNVTTTLGDVIAQGSVATINQENNIVCVTGNTFVQGLQADISFTVNNTTINCSSGNVIANGALSTIEFVVTGYIKKGDKLSAVLTDSNIYVASIV